MVLFQSAVLATPTLAYANPGAGLRPRVNLPTVRSTATTANAMQEQSAADAVDAAPAKAAPKASGRGLPIYRWTSIFALTAAVCWQLTLLLAPLTGFGAHAAKLIVAGAIAGVISRTCCAPLEMVSTVMMCRGASSGGMVEELQAAWNKEGWMGLFKGNAANCLKVAPSRGTQFFVYEFVKRQLVVTGLFVATTGAPLNAGARLLAGGIAGMVAAAIVYPLETVKTVMTLFPEECNNVWDAMKAVHRQAGGIGGLYRGLSPTLIAMFPYVGVEFMVYETLKARYALAFGAPGIAVLLLLGAIGGAAAQATAHPLDVVRRRMQMQGMGKSGGAGQRKISNLFSGLYSIGKHEGPGVLFKGLGPACLEKAPSTAIGYFIYEAMKVSLKVASV